MSQNQTYQLYIGNHCNSCEKVMNYLKDNKIKISTINIDTDDYSLSFPLMIIPALVKENELIGYGEDIKKHFESINHQA